MENNQIHGFAVKEKNDTRIAVGIHRAGISALLVKFGVSQEKIDSTLLGSNEWINISLIRRGSVHPAGFTHFFVCELRRGGDNG